MRVGLETSEKIITGGIGISGGGGREEDVKSKILQL